ncbi:MAG: hypothetical protein P8Z79_26135 [Sedimentisphaerales bacterium]
MWDDERDIFDDMDEEDSDFEFMDDLPEVALDSDIEEDTEGDDFYDDGFYDEEI